MLFVQQTEWAYQQTNLKYIFFQLKIFLTKCLELDSIQENGHISELLFLRNVEFKMQEVKLLFMYMLFSVLNPSSEMLVSYMMKARTFRKQIL